MFCVFYRVLWDSSVSWGLQSFVGFYRDFVGSSGICGDPQVFRFCRVLWVHIGFYWVLQCFVGFI